MGWKAIKETFDIGHAVTVSHGKIFIGSMYVHDLATIDLQTGKLLEHQTFQDFVRKAYPKLSEAKPEEILKLIQTPDEFTASIVVYTYEGGSIVEKVCETPGWPNVTHDGEMMYENTFSTDKATVIGWAKRNAAAAVKMTKENVVRAEEELKRVQKSLAVYLANAAKLETDYPKVASLPRPRKRKSASEA
jgi:hypothetical protein